MNNLKARKAELVEKCATAFNVNKEDILYSRHQPFPFMRYSMFTILYKEGHSMVAIAEEFNKNHATVTYGVHSTYSAIDIAGADPKLKSIYDILARQESNIITTTQDHIVQWLSDNSVDPDTTERLVSTISSLPLY